MFEEQSNVRMHIQRGITQVAMFTLIAVAIVVPVRFFIAQPFIVSGHSMSPTLEKGEYLVIDKLSYHLDTPKRGDVVVFEYPLDPAIFFVKRVIGLPGEGVEVKDGNVLISTQGTTTTLQEPYLVRDERGKDMKYIQLGADEYFVMGDNRDESADSRTWGPLQDRYIVGRALALLFPVAKARMFPGKFEFNL